MEHLRYLPDNLLIEDEVLLVQWQDGHLSRFPAIWLYAACRCSDCGSSEPAVRHRTLADIPAEPSIVSALLNADNQVLVDWGDSHRSGFAADWLRSHCLSEEERRRRHLGIEEWDQSIASALPYREYALVASSDDHRLDFLTTLHRTGFVTLKDVPVERDKTAEVAALVGMLKLTNYGIFELESKPDPEIVGDTAIPLRLHTDEPYRIDVPGITLFHVLRQSEVGGDSTLADGLMLANAFRKNQPQRFNILTTVPARFHRVLREGRWFDNCAPVISQDAEGRVPGVRLLDRGLAPVDCALDQVQPFYDALRAFLSFAQSGVGTITTKLKSGEMLVFNNQRIMHGRTGFDPATSHRHVRSCHVDLDEFHSSLRCAYRKAGDPRQCNRFGAGTRT